MIEILTIDVKIGRKGKWIKIVAKFESLFVIFLVIGHRHNAIVIQDVIIEIITIQLEERIIIIGMVIVAEEV